MAVFTTLSLMDVNNLLANYTIAPVLEITGIGQGMENSNYLLLCQSTRYVLTILEELTMTQAQFHVQLLATFAAQNCKVAKLIADKDGNYLQSFAKKPVLVSEFVQGKHLQSVNAAQCVAIGEELAKLHLAGAYVDSSYHGTRDEQWLANCVYQASAFLNAAEKADVERVLTAYQSLVIHELPHGFIHGDLFRDNAFFEGDRLTGVIDFYSAGIGFLLYDLAIVVNDWCRNNDNTPNPLLVEKLVQAYSQIRPWTENEKLLWPLMQQVAAMRFWLSRLLTQKNANGFYIDKDPEEFKTLFYHLLAKR